LPLAPAVGDVHRGLLLCLLVVLAGCSGPFAVDSPDGDASSGSVSAAASPDTASTLTAGETTAGPTVTVVEVVDGDTIDVRYENGSTDTVRLLGVDAPETYVENDPAEFEGVPDSEAGRACLEAAGENATDFLQARVDDRIRLVFDAESDRRGGYDRLLAYVLVDGSNLNYRLLTTGHARLYDSTFSLRDRFGAAEAGARDAGRGVWRCRDAD
jgi:micrococcal nuclease